MEKNIRQKQWGRKRRGVPALSAISLPLLCSKALMIKIDCFKINIKLPTVRNPPKASSCPSPPKTPSLCLKEKMCHWLSKSRKDHSRVHFSAARVILDQIQADYQKAGLHLKMVMTHESSWSWDTWRRKNSKLTYRKIGMDGPVWLIQLPYIYFESANFTPKDRVDKCGEWDEWESGMGLLYSSHFLYYIN